MRLERFSVEGMTKPEPRYAVVFENKLEYYSQSSNAYAHLMNIGKSKSIAGLRVEVYRRLQWENQTGLTPVDCAIGLDCVSPNIKTETVPEIEYCYGSKEMFFDEEYLYEDALAKDQELSFIPRFCVRFEENYGKNSNRYEWFTKYHEAMQFAEWKRSAKNAICTVFDCEGD